MALTGKEAAAVLKRLAESLERGWFGRSKQDVLAVFINQDHAKEFEDSLRSCLVASKEIGKRKEKVSTQPVGTFFSNGTGGGNRVIRSTKPMT